MKRSIKLPHLRQANQIGFWLCFGAIMFAIYLQYHDALSPCPLCIGQRMIIGFLSLTFLVGWLHLNRGGSRVFHGLCVLIFSLLGAAFAGRQVWLEHIPPEKVPPCGPSFSYMLEHLPFHETLQALFRGTAECAEVSWHMLGLSIPAWTLMLFGLFIILGLWEILREDER